MSGSNSIRAERSLKRVMAHMVRCLLLQEDRRLKILRLALRDFEITGHPQDKVRRRDIYESVAQQLGTIVNNEIALEVKRAMLGLPGVYPIKNGNVRLFRGLRPRVKKTDPARPE